MPMAQCCRCVALKFQGAEVQALALNAARCSAHAQQESIQQCVWLPLYGPCVGYPIVGTLHGFKALRSVLLRFSHQALEGLPGADALEAYEFVARRSDGWEGEARRLQKEGDRRARLAARVRLPA